MTIAVSIRTGSAVVFAADSKVTTRGIVGLEEDGSPRWQNQTYDHAYKIVHDRSKTLMAMVVGVANLGQVSATEFISGKSLKVTDTDDAQNDAVLELVSGMMSEIKAYWSSTKLPEEQWPGPTILMAAASPAGKRPRVWRVELEGGKTEVVEIQKTPIIRMEGSYNEVFPLLYGYESSVLSAVARDIGIDFKKIEDSLSGLKVLRPIDKLNLWAMPVQDAIEFAVFLAKVQVEMERFLPGAPLCGGPIDVMVLQMAPDPNIQCFPGKSIHHPHSTIQK